MLTVIVLYVVLGITGIYGMKEGSRAYLHLDDNDVARYEACIEITKEPKECKDLE